MLAKATGGSDSERALQASFEVHVMEACMQRLAHAHINEQVL